MRVAAAATSRESPCHGGLPDDHSQVTRAVEEPRQVGGRDHLVTLDDCMHRSRRMAEMGLVVDEIVDMVEDRLDIQVGSETLGVLGSAVIKGQATEIIDIGHFLPLAFKDWFRRKEMGSAALTRTILFVDNSPFFRNMLSPVLKAAGYDVTAVGAGDEALAMIKQGLKGSISSCPTSRCRA